MYEIAIRTEFNDRLPEADGWLGAWHGYQREHTSNHQKVHSYPSDESEDEDRVMPTSFRVKTFKGLQDGFEDPVDFIEDIETAVERDYARETATLKAARKQSNGSDDAANAIEERILQDKKDRDCRLLFRQNVSGRADTWYNHLNRDTRRDWTKLRASCLERYRLPEEDPVAKISRMETQYDGMKQARDETITEYLERADDFHAQYGPEKAHLGVKVVQGLKDIHKRDMVLFHLRQKNEMGYIAARKLIVDAFSGVDNPFIRDEPMQKKELSFEDVIRDTMPEVVKGLKHLMLERTQTQQNQQRSGSGASFGRGKETTQGEGRGPRRPLDLSQIECWNCNERGHYSNACPQIKTNQTVAANAVLPNRIISPGERVENVSQEGSSSSSVMCVLTVYPEPVMAANQSLSKNQRGMQPQRGHIQESGVGQRIRETRSLGTSEISRGVQRLTEEQASQVVRPVDVFQPGTRINDTPSTMRRSATPGPSSSLREYQTHEQTIDPTGNRPSYETVTETYRREKVQAGSEPPKVPGPIRVIGSGERFSIAKVLRETAWFLQDATPRFRVRRVKIRDPVSFVSDEAYEGSDRTNQLMICAPAVTSEALEDDGRSSPMVVEAWIGDKKIPRTLLDGGSLVELISERMAGQISACTYVDHGKEISLADGLNRMPTRLTIKPRAKDRVPDLVCTVDDGDIEEMTHPIPLMQRPWHEWDIADPWGPFRRSPMYRGIIEVLRDEKVALSQMSRRFEMLYEPFMMTKDITPRRSRWIE
ncbi:hypothetical protein Pdw03_6113 [Penicillium digitatum]|uniref:CCHC-type domain-containing protein n=1 Tax=Penicillium digitatum TaxID=36651 RepID=A0A7T6XJG5_PENDI|nr:hypothetical protein Pdw03_6113 [Penicillium digitatum]